MENFSANALTSGALKGRDEEETPAACHASAVRDTASVQLATACGGKYTSGTLLAVGMCLQLFHFNFNSQKHRFPIFHLGLKSGF